MKSRFSEEEISMPGREKCNFRGCQKDCVNGKIDQENDYAQTINPLTISA